MDSRLFLLKAKMKLKDMVRRYYRPVAVLPLERFYAQCWTGTRPENGYLTGREVPCFFFDPNAADTYRRRLECDFPAQRATALRRAERARNHRFDLLGSGDTCLGEKIDWHMDFKSGKRWPMAHFSRINIVDPGDDSDVKVPWELSRLQHLTDLGRAYWITGDESWMDEFKAVITDWEENNPVDTGVNWTCSMEVAIRAINIIWGLYFFSAHDGLDDEFIERTVRLLYYHGLHIEKNLEIIGEGSNTNHLLSDYIGLFYLGVLFPEFDRSRKWRTIAARGLEKEMMLEVLSDGVDYECSTSYHRLVEEIFLTAYILGQNNHFEFSKDYRDRLGQMLDYSMAITAPSGMTPLMGDNDDGFIVRLSTENPADHRPLVDVGLTTLGREVPIRFSRTEERLWYNGLESLDAEIVTYEPKSVLFKDAGIAVIQHNEFHLAFNAGKITDRTTGGHKHNDNLSITLEVNRVPYLVDSGSYCYTSDYKMRNYSRSTAAHNTVSVDREEQNRFFDNRLFYMFNDARPKIDLWVRAGDLVVVSATHSGYSRLEDGIEHRRTIWTFLNSNSLAILDEFNGQTNHEHLFETRFFTPLARLHEEDESIIRLGDRGSKEMNLGSFNLVGGQMELRPTEIFPRFGVREQAHLIKYTHQSVLPFRNLTVVCEGVMPSDRMADLRRAADRFKNRFDEMGIKSIS